MARRIRLTDPRRAASRGRRAVEDSIPYPGTVNQPERKFKKRDEYGIEWETTNHPFPDMRTEWKSDARDEIGFGIPETNGPTVASVKIAASKAVRAAVLLLGEKVDDETIEAQARDFMALGPEALDRTLQRFVDSQELYVAEDDKKDEEEESKKEAAEDDDKKDDEESKKAEDDKKDEDESKKAEDDDKKDDAKKDEESKEAADESKDDAKDESKKDDAKEAADDKDEDDKGDESKKDAAVEPKKAEDEDDKDDSKKDDSDASDKKADDDEDEDDEKKEASAPRRGMNELDIELTSASGMDLGDDVEADPRLAEIFEDETIPKEGAETVQPKARKAKAGIKELGGQPRAMTAGQGSGADDISGIWDTAPDVSSVFR